MGLTQVKVCNIDLVPAGVMKAFYVDELEVLVANVNGVIYCLNGRCTHAGAPLAEGMLKDTVLTCPWHGSQFKITDGTVLRGPAEKPLKAYATTVKDGFVFVEI